MTPSPQQEAILTEVRDGTSSLIVEARAGSGKTTTLVMLANEIPRNRLSLFLAFNKNIATELQERLPGYIQAKTFHSHCFSALQRNLPKRPRVDGDKIFKLAKDNWTRREFEQYYKFVSRLVGYAKNAGVGTHILSDEPENWFQLIDHYNLILDSSGSEEEAVSLAAALLGASSRDVATIDFDDMLYLALKRRVTFDKCNYVMLDEAQDTNAVQRELLKGMLAKGVYTTNSIPTYYTNDAPLQKLQFGGRLIAVGDPAQSIYGFRGADADAMDLLRTEFNCKVMPLSISYRCAQTVVKEAQKIVPEIEPHPDAPLGSVERLPNYDLTHFNPEDVILCRVTAPLVSMAFGFIRRNVGVRILGREIGQGLVTLVTKLRAQDLDDLEIKLRNWSYREAAKARSRGHESAASAIEDKAATLAVFIDQVDEDNRTVSEVIRRIESLFSDNNKGLLTLCSVHKAKGLEWEKVFILDREKYMPSKWANQAWQAKQEQNLIYVAVTRAKVDLRYIQSGTWLQPKISESVEQRRKELLESL